MIVAVVLLSLAIAQKGALTVPVGKLGLVLLLPLALIWFPEEFGSFTGYIGHGRRIDAETPPVLISLLGWLLLLGIPLLAYYAS
ncbi:MAG: hypothetical protein JNK76_08435 [Planctomycetales bacterium]|nr:hypothetical protein [Planctomycetales bacterium]MBN8628740.1 hypothetical protein [Planctomycetota bacterium]